MLYANLTTARPAKITSKVEEEEAAHVLELFIDTQKNQPRVASEDVVLWDRPHGTRIELVLKARYIRGRQSPYEYLRGTAIVNPHARIVLVEPDGTRVTFERATDEKPPISKETLPHPYGLELGELGYHLKTTRRPTVSEFLTKDLQGVSLRAAREILVAAGIKPSASPSSIQGDDQERLLTALRGIALVAPTADGLSPIGAMLIKRGLRNVLGEIRPDFYAPPVSRPPKVRGGFPFMVEVGLVYGGALPADQPVQLLRFANRVPLLFQQGACAITNAVSNMDWRRYGLDQKGGAGLPSGPALLLVHVASTKIPFTSEAKEAIAEDPEIDREITLALQVAARHLRTHLSRRNRRDLASEKFAIILKILPKLAEKTSHLVGKPIPDLTPVITRIMDVVNLETPVSSAADGVKVPVDVTNYTPRARVLELFVEIPPELLALATFDPAPTGPTPSSGASGGRCRSSRPADGPTSSSGSRRRPTSRPATSTGTSPGSTRRTSSEPTRFPATGTSGSREPSSRRPRPPRRRPTPPGTEKRRWITMPRSRAKAPTTTTDEADAPRIRADALQPTLALAEAIYEQLDHGEIPRMRLPLRTKQNLSFQMREGVWKLGRQMGTRSARKLDGALMLLRTFYLVDFINEMARDKKTSTLRELYYISEALGGGQVPQRGRVEPPHRGPRGALRAAPGGLPAPPRGERRVGDRRPHDQGEEPQGDRQDDQLPGRRRRRRVLPPVQRREGEDRVRQDQREVRHRHRVRRHGRPPRGERVRRAARRDPPPPQGPAGPLDPPVPPPGHRGAEAARSSSSRTATPGRSASTRAWPTGRSRPPTSPHYLATRSAEFLGVTASDIENYDLPSDHLSEQDIRALQAELTDPRFATAEWRAEIELMLKNGKKAEQQSLAKYGLNYVTEHYLPEKLTEMGVL